MNWSFQLKHVAFASLLIVSSTFSQTSNYEQETQLSRRLSEDWHAKRGAVYQRLISQDSEPMHRLLASGDVVLSHVELSGFPVFLSVENLNAARSLSTNGIWPGGISGLDVSGTGVDYLGLWDGGTVLTGHQEFSGRVTAHDSGTTSSHSTHVAGTLIATGIDPAAKGMAYEANLHAWDWDDDLSEMASAAAGGLRVSNHSYGWTMGWSYENGMWYWFGDVSVSTTEDYRFGYYSNASRDLDELANAYPDYLSVHSAGNDRNDVGPGAGGQHYVFEGGGWNLSTITRDPDGGTSGYDCITSQKVAKNILTVGAVNDLPSGYINPASIIMSDFSGWGPTDDGRIKPDVVANGVDLYSTDDDSDTDYAIMSGTSMASPSVAGSIALLGQIYQDRLGAIPKAATLKGLVIHTADEAGPADGPDYRFGWGLMNTQAAAELIHLQETESYHIRELQLQNGEQDTFFLDISAGTEVRITMSWTDPPGTVPTPSLDPTDQILIHDLDLLLTAPSNNVILPWHLDPTNPTMAATRNNNAIDNVEQIKFIAAENGNYVIRISHKGSISSQNYSLILTGAQPSECLDLTPLSPAVQISLSNNDILLSWLPVTETIDGCQIGAVDYQIWRSENYNISFSLVETTNNTSYLDTEAAALDGLRRYYVVARNSLPTPNLIVVPAGSFSMGQTGVEIPVHQVTLTHSYLLGQTEVTNQQYLDALQWAYNQGMITIDGYQVMGYGVELLFMHPINGEIVFNNGVFSLVPIYDGSYQGQSSANHPVKSVSWYGAACYCDWLSRMSGLSAYYNGNWDQIPSQNNPYLASGYRLPTEAEWEFAAQYDDERTYPWGSTSPTCARTNYCNNFDNYDCCVDWTSPVGTHLTGSNSLGIHDMAGNVWELCNDWYGNYDSNPQTNPIGPSTGNWRVIRGGAWSYPGINMKIADRNYSGPANELVYCGFRVCRTQ